MSKKGSIIHQIDEALNAKIDFGGVDKHAQKKEILEEKIVSQNTLDSYKRVCCAFAKWAKAQHPDQVINSLDRLRPFAEEYLRRERSGGDTYSSWTLKAERAAIAKLYGVKTREICKDLPVRKRAEITRSRGESSRSRSYNAKNHPDVEMLGRAAGLRRMDFSRIEARHVRQDPDGHVYIFVDKSKGGKAREVRVDPNYTDRVLELAAKRKPNERLIPKGEVPKKMDEHVNRRAYAQAMYKMVARPLNLLSKSEKYFCRGDAKGQVFDRQAMAIVSRWLGHGSFNRHTQQWEDRVNVIAGHYLV